jgi:hypothetical protein
MLPTDAGDRAKACLRRGPCEDCGTKRRPRDVCPLCLKVVCSLCVEREGAFCCDGEAMGTNPLYRPGPWEL